MHSSHMLLILMDNTYPGAPGNYSYNYYYSFSYTEGRQVLPLSRKQQVAGTAGGQVISDKLKTLKWVDGKLTAWVFSLLSVLS